MCGCNKKNKAVAPAAMMQAQAVYDFASDPDFILVRITVSGVKVLHTRTMAASAFKQKYGKSNYGAVTNGSMVYMLLSDLNAPDKYPTIGLSLVIPPAPDVAPIADVEEVVTEEVVTEESEVEMAAQVIVELTKVKGVGKATANKLVEMGYKTIESLIYMQEYEWVGMSQFTTAESYAEMVESARSLVS